MPVPIIGSTGTVAIRTESQEVRDLPPRSGAETVATFQPLRRR